MSQYIEWRVTEAKVLQEEFFCGKDGNVIVDFVGHLETIQRDFQQICDVLSVDASLPYKNRSSHHNYREYYTPQTRQLVAKHFRNDINRFGYSFDEVTDVTPVTT